MSPEYTNASGFAGRILFLFFLLCWPGSAPVRAEPTPVDRALAAADSLNLAAHPTWRRLLHFEDGKKTSSVLSDSFFLALEGRVDPRAELDAVLTAYFEPGPIDNAHPRCRFPARYHWLSHQIELPEDTVRTQCPGLKEWQVFEPGASISLLMVSGFLGNPASTFGHALLKLNTAHSSEVPSLFEPTINFGANIPQQENPVLYVLRGLVGGYEAEFSDQYFYTHDLVYSQTEFRDMWEFRLNLTEYQRLLLGLHAWEIIGKPYQYLFLGKNCGFRLAELVDLALEEEVFGRSKIWYAPVELFNRLDGIDRQRKKTGDAGLIEFVTYIPSARRKLFHELAGLSDAETGIVKRLLDGGGDASVEKHLAELDMDAQVAVLNGLLAFYHYLDTAEGRDRDAARDPVHSQVLLARLRRPAQPIEPPVIPVLAPPTEGLGPMTIGIGAGVDVRDEPFALFNWAAYKQEAIGHNSLAGSELVVADVQVGVGGDAGALHLSRLELVRLQNLNTMAMRILNEHGLSWRLRLGMDRRARRGGAYDGTFAFGMGRAWRWGRLIGYGLLNLEGHTHASHARARPELKLLFGGGPLRAGLGVELVSRGYRGNFGRRGSWQLLYRLGRNRSLTAGYRPGSEATTVGLNQYF